MLRQYLDNINRNNIFFTFCVLDNWFERNLAHNFGIPF